MWLLLGACLPFWGSQRASCLEKMESGLGRRDSKTDNRQQTTDNRQWPVMVITTTVSADDKQTSNELGERTKQGRRQHALAMFRVVSSPSLSLPLFMFWRTSVATTHSIRLTGYQLKYDLTTNSGTPTPTFHQRFAVLGSSFLQGEDLTPTFLQGGEGGRVDSLFGNTPSL